MLIKATKKQLTNIFEVKNLKEIEDTCTRYNNITIQDIFTYLHDHFRDTILIELEKAEKTLMNLLTQTNLLDYSYALSKMQ